MNKDGEDNQEREEETTDHNAERTAGYMALGAAVGFALGAVFSFTVMDSILYAPVGMLFGLAVGAGIKRKPKE